MLKEKLEYNRPKSYIDPVSITTNVSDRLGKLKDSSASWRNRVEAKDAEKFTVAAKTSDQPAQLPFQKSAVRTSVPMVEFQSANPAPLGLAKSSSMVVSSVIPNGSGHKVGGLQLPAFARSVSVPGPVEENHSIKVTVPKLDEDKLFDQFFTTPSPTDENTNMAMDWMDLDAVTSTERWVEDVIQQLVFYFQLVGLLFISGSLTNAPSKDRRGDEPAIRIP